MHKYLTILYSTTLLVACSTSEDPIIPSPNPGDGLVEIAFASSDAGQESTTRAEAKTHPLAQDFVVFGYKTMSDQTRQTVFENDIVSYDEDNKNYSYEPPRYWDKNAEEYRFFGYSSTKVAPTVTDDGMMTIDAPISQVEDFYYSGNVKVVPDNYGETVKLTFKKLYTIVEVKFFTDISLSDGSVGDVNLSDIIFTPKSGEKISVEGSVKIDYTLTGDPNETITWPEGTLSELNFQDVMLTESICGKDNALTAIPETETGTDLSVYTIYPTFKGTLALSLKVNGEEKGAEVPNVGWEANHKYVYLFKVDGGLDPILFDVKVEPWIKGGQQDLEFKNW